MAVHKVKLEPGKHPRDWPVVKVADVDGNEPFVKAFLELPPLVDAGTIYDPQRSEVKSAIHSILIDGIMPAFLDLQRIRASVGRDIPLMDRAQPYEDLAGKLWKLYKELTQNAARLMGFNIGFLFMNDKNFRDGLKKFRADNPELLAGYDKFLEETRDSWQNDLAKFRNTWLEHPTGDPKQFSKFYTPEYAEMLFDAVWRTICDILPPLLELKLPNGVKLIEQDPNDPAPRGPQRFQYHHPSFANMK
jgi:hypothetical protein